MRRILVLAFAVAATFSVLANNFIPVSAPASFGEFSYKHAGPNGAAQLSDVPVATTVAAIPGAQQADTAGALNRPDLNEFTEHEPAVSVSDIRTIAGPPNFVHAQAYRPLTTFTRQKLSALPMATVMPDALAEITREHKATTSIVASAEERLAASAERASIRNLADLVLSDQQHTASANGQNVRANDERVAATADSARVEPKLIPLTTSAANLFRTVKKQTLNELPSLAPAMSRLADTSATHSIASTADATIAERIEVAAESAVIRRPVAASFVTAAYSAPDESIFHRARYVVEPYSPVSTNSLAVFEAEHAGIDGIDSDSTEREIVSADTAEIRQPEFVATSTDSPATDFERARIAPIPQAPILSESLAVADAHTVNAEQTDSVREIETVAAEAAPKATYVPAFLTALAEAPIAVFQRIGLIAMPQAPPPTIDRLAAANSEHVATTSTSTIEADRLNVLPDAATIAKQVPVSITASTAMNADMLKPMSAGPLVDAPLLNENAIASNGSTATAFDRMIDTPDVPEAILKARPVTISSNTEFSNALLAPMNPPINPFQKMDKAEVLSAIQQTNNYCDPNFVGPPIRFSQTVELKLDDLLRQLHQRFGVNFIVGKGVAELPMNIKAGSIPWNVLLKSQLFISGVRARCIDQNTIELVENSALSGLQDQADVETRFVKLKFLQRTGGGTVDLANRSQGGQSGNQGGGCGGNNQGGTSGSVSTGGGGGGGQQGQTVGQLTNNKFDKLIVEIEKILGLRSMQESSVGSGSDSGGGGANQQQREASRSNRFVTQIPGRNILAIRATKEEHDLIDQILVRADRPPFQVVIKGLVYTANQDKLRDIGVSTTITGGTADGRSTGGIFGDTLGVGTLFDFSTVMGTFDFNVQATAFQQNGVIAVKSRPFATVIDGLCTTLDVGRQLPIVIDSSLGGAGDVVFVNAANNLAVTPYVIDDEQGNPVAVTLELRLTANDIDSSVTARGVPAISARSIQTQLLLDENKTAILGGFTVDSDSRSVQKTPGLGDIPIIGELFKRRIRDTRVNRLYFAVAVDILPYPEPIRPVDVPGADPQPPSLTPEQKKRADAAEPKQVKGP